MSAPPVLLRERAKEDARRTARWYLEEAGTTVALRIVESLERVYERIAAFPESGSPRYAHRLHVAGLRVSTVSSFPYRIFYRVEGERVVVWRILHAARDLPEWLAELDDSE